MIKKEKYSAAILVIGDEILSGRTQDTNSNFIAKEMEVIGIDTNQYKDFDSYMTKLDPVAGYLSGKFGKESADSLVNDFLFTYG